MPARPAKPKEETTLTFMSPFLRIAFQKTTTPHTVTHWHNAIDETLAPGSDSY